MTPDHHASTDMDVHSRHSLPLGFAVEIAGAKLPQSEASTILPDLLRSCDQRYPGIEATAGTR